MRTLVKLALLGLVSAAAACGGDGVNEPTSLAGTYQLQSIDGQSPPVTVYEEPGFKVEILSGNFVLSANRTFTSTVNFRSTIDGQVTTDSETFSGTYTVSGSAVTFDYGDGDTDTATVSGNTLTFSGDGFTAVFRK